MSTFKIRDLYPNDRHHRLCEYTRDDGTSFLTSPSLREQQIVARERQATALGDTLIDPAVWSPYDGSAPKLGYAARWTDEHGWVVVTRHRIGITSTHATVMSPLPDLPAGIDHPVFETNAEDETAPFIAGGNRSSRSRHFYIDPISLGMGTGIFFHTRNFGTYRDGGTWTITEATLVYDTSGFFADERKRTYFGWGQNGRVERHAVQVLSKAEWIDDPARAGAAMPLGGKPIVISYREPLVRFLTDGSLQRIRLSALQGQLAAIVYRLAEIGPGKPGEPPNAKELDFLENTMKPKHSPADLARIAAELDAE